MLSTFSSVISGVRERNATYIYRNFPTGPGHLKSKEQREVQFCENKLLALYKKLRSNPDRADAAEVKSQVVDWKRKYAEAAEIAGWAVL